MLKKTFLGVLFAVFVSGLLVVGITFDVTKAVDHGSSGTYVGGIIWENTTWTLANSPYIITDLVQIPEDVTLVIESGVTVIAYDGSLFLVEGKIYAHGTLDNRITFDGGGKEYTKFFWNSEDYDCSAFVDLDYCIIKNGGNIWDGGYGHFSLRHSEVINLKACSFVYYPKRDVYIEYNKFINSGCFEILQSEASVYIRNNLFIGKGVGEFYLISTGASYGNSMTIVQYNSFIGISDKILSVGNEGAMDATENYWGTLDTSAIDHVIWDRHDSILCKNFIEYLPVLTMPHPDTPIMLENVNVDIKGFFREDSDYKWRCYANITIRNSSLRNITISWIFLNAINITYIDETFEELNISGNETLNYVIQPEQELSVNWTITTFGFTKEPKILWVLFKTSISEAYGTITLTTVIPEFPSFLITPLFMISTLLAVTVYRRKHSKADRT